MADPQGYPKSIDFCSNCNFLASHGELDQMNATTILSTTKMYIDSAFMKIRGLLFFAVILVLSSGLVHDWAGGGPHPSAYRGPRMRQKVQSTRDHSVKNQNFHAKMNIPEFFRKTRGWYSWVP